MVSASDARKRNGLRKDNLERFCLILLVHAARRLCEVIRLSLGKRSLCCNRASVLLDKGMATTANTSSLGQKAHREAHILCMYPSDLFTCRFRDSPGSNSLIRML